MSTVVPFVKMVGAGNDFLIVDAVHERVGALKAQWPALARAMCERRYGIGADGLLILEASRKADCRMRIFNPDGSEAEMCGNGARCVAAFINQWKSKRGGVSIETTGGLVAAQVRGNRVRMAMPQPRDLKLGLHIQVDGRLWPLGYVDTGVPHAVAVVRRVDEVNVMQVGRRLRFHPAFHPRGTNVDFIEISRANPDRLKIRTYERGVEGETPACGTGVTAAAIIHALTRSNGHHTARASRAKAYRIAVQTRSGETLTVSLRVEPHGQARGPLQDAPCGANIPPTGPLKYSRRGPPAEGGGPDGGVVGRPASQVSDVILEGAVRWVCQGRFAGRV